MAASLLQHCYCSFFSPPRPVESEFSGTDVLVILEISVIKVCVIMPDGVCYGDGSVGPSLGETISVLNRNGS